eukprot:TRINITY_DN19572_c0_g1_i1.p1 TRINITY_DN19572_c0_g1~~TRINITY_DN19572_c0_g1_i1.p1  ORF type:complete len:193 (+),score=23.53 TRINITY_DN19572_c0_g1_i1:46-579(+)
MAETLPALLVVGGVGSGMSTLLEQLRAYSKDCCIPSRNMKKLFPTIGVDVTTAKINKTSIRIIEVGGSMISHAHRQLTQRDFSGVLFVIDSTRPEDLALTSVELANLVANPKLKQTPILVVINKADAPAKLPLDVTLSCICLDELQEQGNVSCIEASGATGHNVNLVANWVKEAFGL